PPTAEEANIDESQQGVTFLERLMVKNLANNPWEAARWLRAKGYESFVYSPGSGLARIMPMKMRIAVRKPGEETYKVVDPAGFDWQDLSADMWGDLIFGAEQAALTKLAVEGGAAAGTAATGTPFGTAAGAATGLVAGGAMAGRATEATRQ